MEGAKRVYRKYDQDVYEGELDGVFLMLCRMECDRMAGGGCIRAMDLVSSGISYKAGHRARGHLSSPMGLSSWVNSPITLLIVRRGTSNHHPSLIREGLRRTSSRVRDVNRGGIIRFRVSIGKGRGRRGL